MFSLYVRSSQQESDSGDDKEREVYGGDLFCSPVRKSFGYSDPDQMSK